MDFFVQCNDGVPIKNFSEYASKPYLSLQEQKKLLGINNMIKEV